MAKKAAGKAEGPTTLVIGNHPAALVAALKLNALKADAAIADPSTFSDAGRLVTINPSMIQLLPALADVLQGDSVGRITSVRFHAADGKVAETTDAFADGEAPAVLKLADLILLLRERVEAAGIRRLPGRVTVNEVDESGILLTVGRTTIRPRVCVLSDTLEPESAALLGTARPTEQRVMAMLDVNATLDAGLAHAALDLNETGAWGMLVATGTTAQITVVAAADEARDVLRSFAGRLAAGGVLSSDTVDGRSIRTAPVTPAGALEFDVVARHALLCGPAGGFVTAVGEDVYPGCWSGTYAAATAAKAAKAVHVQDALGDYRSAWGGSLGEYLQGPQQNMKFLLPLMFRNPIMTDRLADALFRGKSVVR